MALRYWVGGSGLWSDTTKWSTTSGGAGGASVPTAADDVIIDANSGSPNTDLNGNRSCLSLTTTGATCRIDDNTLSVSGNVTLSSGTTTTTIIQMVASGTFTRAGATVGGSLVFAGGSGASYTIADTYIGRDINLNSGTLDIQASVTTNVLGVTINGGTFNTNANNVSTRYLECASGSTLNMGSGTWTITGTSLAAWNTPSTMTLNTETANIVFDCTDTSISFTGGGRTFNNLTFANSTTSQVYTFTDGNTFNEFKSTKTVRFTIIFTAGTTTTFSTFSISGFSGSNVDVQSTSTTKAVLIKPSVWAIGLNSTRTRCSGIIIGAGGGIDFLDFQDIEGQSTGAADNTFLQMFD